MAPSRVFDIGGGRGEFLDEVAEMPDVSGGAVKLAQETKDELLEVQIQTCMLARVFIQSLAAGKRCFRHFLRVEERDAPRPMSHRSIRMEQVSVLGDLAAHRDAFLGIVRQSKQVIKQEKDARHLLRLDNIVDLFCNEKVWGVRGHAQCMLEWLRTMHVYKYSTGEVRTIGGPLTVNHILKSKCSARLKAGYPL